MYEFTSEELNLIMAALQFAENNKMYFIGYLNEQEHHKTARNAGKIGKGSLDDIRQRVTQIYHRTLGE